MDNKVGDVKIFGITFTPEEINLLFGSNEKEIDQDFETNIEETIENLETDPQEILNRFTKTSETEDKTLHFLRKLPTYHNCKTWEDIRNVLGENTKETTCITLFALGNILPVIEPKSGLIVGPILAKIAYHNSKVLKQKFPNSNWEQYFQEFFQD